MISNDHQLQMGILREPALQTAKHPALVCTPVLIGYQYPQRLCLVFGYL